MTGERADNAEAAAGGGLVLAQVAVVGDEAVSVELVDWYQGVLGFVPSGGMTEIGGPEGQHIMRLDEEPDLDMTWMVDANHPFQLEVFAFRRPRPKARPAGWTARDVGFTTITVEVDDFDAVLGRLGEAGSPVGATLGAAGARRALTAEPGGTLIEVVEHDVAGTRDPSAPGARPGVAVRGIRASVPDVAAARAFYATAFGLPVAADDALHAAAHEPLWGLDDAPVDRVTFAAGGLFVEFVQYDDPPGAPWPADRLLTDAGIMNIALCTPSKAEWETIHARVVEHGGDTRDFEMGDDVCGSYVLDPQGLGIELLFIAPAAYEAFGFVALEESAGSTGEETWQ